VLRIPLSGRYPPLPVPVQRRTSHPSRSARGLMPKAARARVASPPAGTALTRAIRDCLPDRVREGRDSILHVTLSVTYVNITVTHNFGRGQGTECEYRAAGDSSAVRFVPVFVCCLRSLLSAFGEKIVAVRDSKEPRSEVRIGDFRGDCAQLFPALAPALRIADRR